jgi:hypothetical protein
MQHNLAQLEYGRTAADERARKFTGAARSSGPPPKPRVARRRAARVLARIAWRLDREAALKAWP